MTDPRPLPIFGRHEPREPDAVRIENRSDRVWVFGFVRMLPGVLFFGSLLAMYVLAAYGPPVPLWLAFVGGVAVIAIPFALDRSTVLDPVDYILIGRRGIHVKRLAGKRNFWLHDVRRVEFGKPAGEDYDERQKLRRYAQVTIRLPGIRLPARLLVSEREAGLVREWAEGHRLPIHEIGTSPD
jgi:hypothetical protein